MEHPITPPPELVQQWASESLATQHLCTQAARWGADQQLKLDAEQIAQAYQAGADQELEACCEWVRGWYGSGCGELINGLRAARRPKPPSLKEQALEQLDKISTCFRITHGGPIVCDKIREALEALPND